MTYGYIRVTYGWHTSTYEWHTDDIRVHTSDIRMAYEYIRVTYGWHTSTYEWYTNDIWVTYRWHVLQKKNKVNFFEAFYKFSFKITLFFYKKQQILFKAGCSYFFLFLFFFFWGWNVLNLFLFPRLYLAMPQRRTHNKTHKKVALQLC